MIRKGPLAAALVSGLVVGGGLVAYLAMQKGHELELRGRLLSAALAQEGTGVEAVLITQGTNMQPRLVAYATAAAEAHLAQAYGLTPERIQGITRLGTRLGLT